MERRMTEYEQKLRQEQRELEEREKSRAYQFPMGKIVPDLRSKEED